MTHFYHEHELWQQMRDLDALDRQLEHRGWFRRHEHRPHRRGWLFRAGEALIRLDCWLQERRGPQSVRTPGEL